MKRCREEYDDDVMYRPMQKIKLEHLTIPATTPINAKINQTVGVLGAFSLESRRVIEQLVAANQKQARILQDQENIQKKLVLANQELNNKLTRLENTILFYQHGLVKQHCATEYI